MLKKIYKYLLFIVVSIFFISLLTGKIVEDSRKTRLQEEILTSALYREQHIGEEVVSFLQTVSKPGKYVGLYLLESKFGYQDLKKPLIEDIFNKLEKEWKKEENYSEYIKTTEVIWNDVKYFPVPDFTTDKSMTVSYANSWMSERTYGGERGHEGVDIMAGKNERGLYPVISMTDGVVSKKGWLDKGGYRIGAIVIIHHDVLFVNSLFPRL